jgi:alkylhydroperoxidase family enzyme
VDINTASGEAAGVDGAKFGALADYASSPLFTPLERLVLAYADGMTISGRDTDDDAFAALRRHFPPDALVELTAHVAFENFRSRFNHAFRIEAQGFCRLDRGGASVGQPSRGGLMR